MFSLSIKHRLLINFIVLSVLIGAYIAYEIGFVRYASEQFNTYRSVARASVALKSIEGELLLLESSNKEFMRSFDPALAHRFGHHYETLEHLIARLRGFGEVMHPYAHELSNFEVRLKNYKSDFESVAALIVRRNTIKTQQLEPTAREIERLLEELAQQVHLKHAVPALQNSQLFLRAQRSLFAFLWHNSEDSFVQLSWEFKALQEGLYKASKEESGQLKKLQRLETLLQDYTQNIEAIHALILERNTLITHKLQPMEQMLLEQLETLSDALIARQDALGPQMVAYNTLFLERSILFSAVVLLLFVGVSLAFMYDFLSKLSRFQNGLIAFFTFIHDRKKRPKPIGLESRDEIGAMAVLVDRNIEETARLILERDQISRLNQEILNAQSSLVLLTDGEIMVTANRSLLDFFGFESVEDFSRAHPCVCDYFEAEEGMAYIQREMEGLNWADYIVEHRHKTHNVKMLKRVFHIHVRRFHFEGIDKYVVVFDDISDEIVRQKELQEHVAQIEILNQELAQQAVLDPLTRIFNRRDIIEHFEKIFEVMKRQHAPISLLMLDIDWFKQVNDTHGHDKGDEVIRALADALKVACRESDIVGRFGGEEFLMIMSDTDQAEACSAAERLRSYIQTHAIGGLSITISCGVTTRTPIAHESATHFFDAMVNEADQNLYLAKHEGRNRVVGTQHNSTHT
ncbi:MAG: diguanylate cyclase [Campylobacterales bacterium]|nr:diguanylate cyclase [Campylobacterales bacterium]